MNSDYSTPLKLNKDYFLKSSFFIITLCVTVLQAILQGEPSIIFSFIALFFLGGIVIGRFSEQAKLFFVYSFCINTLFAILLTSLFKLEHGSPFIKGMLDDERFFLFSRDYKNGLLIFDGNFYWSAINYKAYIIVLSGWLRLLNICGFSSDYFLNLNILNSAFGAMAVSMGYLIFNKLSTSSDAKKIAWIILLYPPVIYYSATLIRDTVVTLVFLLSIWLLMSDRSGLKKLLLIIVCTFLLYHIRDASALFLLVFATSFMMLSTKHKINLLIARATLLAGIAGLFIIFVIALSIDPPKQLPPRTDLLNHLSFRIHFYNDAASEESSENSLGAKLKSSQNPALLSLSVFHMFFSPAPPLFFYSSSVSNFFLGIGNVMWYFFGFCYLMGVKSRLQDDLANRVWWAAFVTAFFALILINFTSGNFRHFNFIQPLLIGFSMLYVFRNKRELPSVLKLLLVVFIVLTLTYLALKFIT